MTAARSCRVGKVVLGALVLALQPACSKENSVSQENTHSGAVCPKGARYCDGNTLVICNESQTEWVRLSCESEASCDAGLSFGICGEDVDTNGQPLTCDFPLADCNVVAADGCETNLGTNAHHCGECGNDCSAPNADASCRSGACQLECDDGFADCNGKKEDGCEIDLESDESHCGACGRACDDSNGTVACSNGLCSLVTCRAGYGDCDEDPTNGCETVTLSTVRHCGACGEACENEHGSTDCDAGRCQPVCAAGYGDCDGDGASGCETDLRSTVEHCGTCGNSCPGDDRAACVAGSCALECEEGTADCNDRVGDGCEIDLESDDLNCGACGRACESANGTTACSHGLCSLVTCNPGYGDCDENPENGCETVIHSSEAHCGACGTPCVNAHGTSVCEDGRCEPTCGAGYGDCDGDGANGCETDLGSSVAHCGVCGHACGGDEAVCVSGECDLPCPAGMGDCDSDPENGCETALDGPDHCGGCFVVCENDHGSNVCNAGRCEPTCAADYGDCDGDAANGCETFTASSADHCGACGVVCASVHGEAVCSSGSCSIVCDADYANCDHDPSNGCEVFLPGDPRHCGACDESCASLGGSATCDDGVCALVCDGTMGDCDGDVATGCEVDTAASVEHCGGCDQACGDANASPECQAGACVLHCSIGYENCDGNQANGCETALTTATNHCGRCGHSCLGGACEGGICQPHALVTNEPSPTQIRLDEGNVYWLSGTSSADSVIRRIAKSGGAAGDVATSSSGICDFAVADSVAWTTSADGAVWLQAKTGGSPLALASGQAGPCPIAMNDAWVVWGDQVSNTVWKRSLATGSSNVAVAEAFWPGTVFITGDYGYVGGEGIVGRFLLSSGGIGDTLRLLHSTWDVEGIAANEDDLCYMQTMYGRVYCTPAPSMISPDEYLVEPGYTMQTSLALDDTFVYYLTPSAVERAAIDSGAANVVATSSQPWALALDEDGIYWTEPNVGRVMVLAKP